MILIVSTDDDDHAGAVIDALDGRDSRVALLDLSDFPQRFRLSVDLDGSGSPGYRLVDYRSNELDLAECNVVWWRRPQQYALHPEIRNGSDAQFAYRECHSALQGLWSSLEAAWVNDPLRDEEAARKVYQLKLAREVGFEVPETLVTNDPDEARAFVDRFGPESTVYKQFTAMPGTWRETRVVRPDETAYIDAVKYAPVIFQEYVPASVDLRVTVVGDEVFAAAIHSQETEYVVDYRMTMDQARIESFDLPGEVRERIHEFVDRLGLVYGAIDMRLTPDDRYVFLEINPTGQWLFVERRTDLPVTETVADALCALDDHGGDRDGIPTGDRT